MVDIEDKDGELIFKVSTCSAVSARTVIRISDEASCAVADICSRTGLKPGRVASELIIFAAMHTKVRRNYEAEL